MSLSNCNIRDLLREQVSTYLKENDPSFDELKACIITKTPIAAIQSFCTQFLSELYKKDKMQLKKTLESQILKKQIAEDEQENKKDSSAEIKDKDIKKRLTRDFDQTPELLINYENQIIKLRGKLNRLMSASRVDMTDRYQSSTNSSKSKSLEATKLPSDTQHVDNYSKSPHPPYGHLLPVLGEKGNNQEVSLEIEQLRNSITQYESKIRTLNARHFDNQIKIKAIEDREQERHQRKTERNERAHARAGYQSTGELFLETLSSENQEQFSRHLKEHHSALDVKHSELIHESQHLNFPIFMELLPKHLDRLKLSDPEIEALRNVLKFMKKHMDYQLQSSLTQELLNKKKLAISAQIVKLNQFNAQLSRLQKSNPNLSDTNKKLLDQNKELEANIKKDFSIRKRLALPGLLLLTLSFLFTIPLILTACGVIPFFIAPALLFTLVATPPSLLVAATIAIGIAALVFYGKERSSQSTIAANLKTIQNNKALTKKNDQNLRTLKEESIPSAEKQIKSDEIERDRLSVSVKEKQDQAEHYLKQAKSIEPISFAESSLLEDQSGGDPSDDEIDLSEEFHDRNFLSSAPLP